MSGPDQRPDADDDLLALVEVTAEHPVVSGQLLSSGEGEEADVDIHSSSEDVTSEDLMSEESGLEGSGLEGSGLEGSGLEGSGLDVANDGQQTEWFTVGLDDFAEIPDLPFDRREHHVTAVVVTHDGGVWLSATLTTLAAQNRPVDGVVGVDVASTDESLGRLRSSLGEERVVAIAKNIGFGEAVAAGLEHIDQMVLRPQGGYVDSSVVEWVWLLHDDSAPDVDALQALLDAADKNPSVAVLGPKVLGWHDRRLLLEVGFSITGSGRRFTGLERREHDQAQHDGDRDVMAVGSAGMLIRRDVWEHLDGFDHYLPLFRDDLDFCWRAHRAGERVMVATDAVVHHREASAHGRRLGSAARPHRLDREASVHVLLAHASAVVAPFLALRLLLGSALQSLSYLIGKDIAGARDELGAVWSLIAHPGRVRASRTRISHTSIEPASCVRHLRPTTWSQLSAGVEAAIGLATTSNAAPSASVSGIDAGPVDEDSESMETGTGWFRRAVVRPSVLLGLALTVYATVALRAVIWGEGVLQGGALLPSPAGASDLWQQYAQGWHDVGPGSTVPGAPYLLIVWTIAAFLLGKAPVAVAVMFLLALPLAGWSAYFALRGVIASRGIRIWAGVAYAFLPAITGAVSSGRLGTVIAAFALPFAVRSIARTASPRGTFRRAAGTALLIAVVMAAAPSTWLLALAAVLVLVGLAWRQRGRQALQLTQRLGLAILGPLVLLLPWSAHLFANPVLFLSEPGAPVITSSQPTPVDVLLLAPGGPGMTPTWATLGLVVAGTLALVRRDRIRLTSGALAVGAGALALGVFQVIVPVTAPNATSASHTWPGIATLMLGACFIVAAALAADGLRARFTGASFSLGQPLAAFLAVLVIAAPIVAAGTWFNEATGLLRKAPAASVPAFVAADATSPQAPRTLILREQRSGEVLYSLVNGGGPLLGDADVSPDASVWEAIDPLVAALASGRGGEEVEALAGYGVRYVLMAAGTNADLIPILDAAPGLRRLSTSGGETLWRIAGDTSRARLVAADSVTAVGVRMAGTLGVDPYVDQTLPSAGTLVLGASKNSSWQASAINSDGSTAPLEAVDVPGNLSWSQGFTVPAGSRVIASFDGGARTAWLVLQLLAFAILVILALPSRRAEEDFDAAADDAFQSEASRVGSSPDRSTGTEIVEVSS